MTRWQQLGAFVATCENLSDDALNHFAGVGGRWIVPVLYNDDRSGPWNLANIASLKARAGARGIAVGGWFNYFGGDPDSEADAIASIVHSCDLGPVVIDTEAAVQFPGGRPELLPAITYALRKRLPTRGIAVSGLGPDNAFIYNGRTNNPPRSFYDLGVRMLPQWYDPYYKDDGNATPQARTAWLRANASTDFNFRDDTAPSKRGLPISYVHPTVEVTGLEGADLARELSDVAACGLGPGLSLYLLENAPDTDWALLAAVRGRLFLA